MRKTPGSPHRQAEYQRALAAVVGDAPILKLAMFHHRNTRGQPMSLKDKPSLIEMYRDFPNLEGADIRKAVQTGVSELMIMLALERSGWAGRITSYVLPTYQIRNRFVQTRVDPLLQVVPTYRALCPGGLPPTSTEGKEEKGAGASNLRLKQFGRGRMMFLGSNTATEFVEFSADVMIVDELDRCDQQNLTLARDRLRASPHPQMFRLSNPTYPNVGIDTCYSLTDRRKWFTRCGHCQHWQTLDWFVHFVEQDDSGNWVAKDVQRLRDPVFGDLRPVCSRCNEPFERTTVGCWVPEDRTKSRRGYTMSRLEVLSQNISALFSEWQEAQSSIERMQAFYNSILGKPYEPAGASITVTDLRRAAVGYATDKLGDFNSAEHRITCGIDVGALLHIQISRVEVVEEEPTQDAGESEETEADGLHTDFVGEKLKRVTLWVGTMRSFDDVYELLTRWNVDICVVDSQPETRKAQELRDRCRENTDTIIWLAQFYPTTRVGNLRYGMRMDHRSAVVRVDRTQVLDATMDELRIGDHVLPENILSIEGYADQMCAPQRILSDNKDRYIWAEGNKDDHYRFADVYDRVAFDLLERGGSFFVL